mgnify:FL=1
MKKIAFLAVAFLAAGALFAQDEGQSPREASSLSDPDPSTIGNESASQALREVSVDRFEREGSWSVHISPDYGVITGRLFDGAPDEKEPLEDEDNKEASDTKVFGLKVEFFKRGVNSFYIRSARPIPIEGVTKTVSVWVAGRNQNHTLTLLLQDYFGNNFELYVGNLAFSGWKKLTVAIPPTPDGVHGIIQTSAYNGDRPGVRILGFRVDCDPMAARGTYYMYLDDMRAVTDLYDMENRDEDDPKDNW